MPQASPLREQPGVFLDSASISVMIGSVTVFVTPDMPSATRISRLLSSARESKHHTAMQILTEQLFLGEETAQYVLHMLHEEHNPIGVHDGKPN